MEHGINNKYYSCVRTDYTTQVTNYYQYHTHDEEANKPTWHLFNDEKVHPITVDTLKQYSKDAYLLFYRRREEVNADRKEEIEIIDQLSKPSAHLQPLVEDLLNTNKTEELTEARKTINELRNENESLKSESIKLKRINKEALMQMDSLRTEKETLDKWKVKATERINNLMRENSILSEECKETQLELHRLRAIKLDPRHYLQWSDSEVVDWIISIEDGKYAVYEENLRLLFASENVNGSVLSQISKQDLKDWGIKNFALRSSLHNQIQKLIAQKCNDDANQDIEGTTAYIG
eukprot:840208_1